MVLRYLALCVYPALYLLLMHCNMHSLNVSVKQWLQCSDAKRACAGNPFVTPDTTRDVVITARLSAVNVFFDAIEKLMFELSIWRCTPEMQACPVMLHLMQITLNIVLPCLLQLCVVCKVTSHLIPNSMSWS